MKSLLQISCHGNEEDNYDCKGCQIGGSCYRVYGLSGECPATLRRSLRTPILIIVAFAALIWDCRNMRLHLPFRFELPQLTKVIGERF